VISQVAEVRGAVEVEPPKYGEARAMLILGMTSERRVWSVLTAASDDRRSSRGRRVPTQLDWIDQRNRARLKAPTGRM
jgi:hypothetical protein